MRRNFVNLQCANEGAVLLRTLQGSVFNEAGFSLQGEFVCATSLYEDITGNGYKIT
jgi:hypothetical protein